MFESNRLTVRSKDTEPSPVFSINSGDDYEKHFHIWFGAKQTY